MSEEIISERPLFGGAISCTFPSRFQDVSNVRQVPDNQEVFTDPERDESLIFELLEYKDEVVDNESAAWFLQDIAAEQDADGCVLLEHSGVVEASGLQRGNFPTLATTAVGQMPWHSARQARRSVRKNQCSNTWPVHPVNNMAPGYRASLREGKEGKLRIL